MAKTDTGFESVVPGRVSGKTLSVVFSFRNEEENIPELVRRTRAVCADLRMASTIASYELNFCQ